MSAVTPEAAVRVYALLEATASAALASGFAVVADAVFARPVERAAIAQIAEAVECPFHGIWLTAPEYTRLDRIGSRSADASDATIAIALAQSAVGVGDLNDWTALSAGQSLALVANQARRLIRGDVGKFV